MKKNCILGIILIIFLLSISTASAGLFDGLFGDNDENFDDYTDEITLIKESTEYTKEIHDDGSERHYYQIEGVLKGLPDNLEGYNLMTSIYDENGNLIRETDSILSIEYIAESSEKSETTLIGSMGFDDFKNVDVYELKLYDPDGVIIFEENVTFNMENVDTVHTGSSNDDSSSDSSSSDTGYSSSQSSSSSGSYVGNANSGKFHSAGCGSVDKMSEKNKVFFSSRDEAINQGYVPCQRCNP